MPQIQVIVTADLDEGQISALSHQLQETAARFVEDQGIGDGIEIIVGDRSVWVFGCANPFPRTLPE